MTAKFKFSETTVSCCLLVCAILAILNACKSNDPQPGLLVGSWKQTAYKNGTDGGWKPVSSGQTVRFKPDGKIEQPDGDLLSGGWCNPAERYTVSSDQLLFEFGPVNCIPFVDPKVPAEAKIIKLTAQELMMQWGRITLIFLRV